MNAPLEFHELRVAAVDRLTPESVAVTMEVPEELHHVFGYRPGQHVTVRTMIDGDDVRRSYSICAPPRLGRIRVGIKQLQGGAFSTFANTRLKVGDVLDVMPPVGDFVVDIPRHNAPRYVAIVAGSGITPVLSMVASSLEEEPTASWLVMYGNRDAGSIMFLDELEGLKDRYTSRFQLIHVLSREDTGLALTSGRIDAERVRLLLDKLVDASQADRFFLCGPYEMVMAVRGELEAQGVASDRILDELFFAGPPAEAPSPPAADAEGAIALDFVLDGRRSSSTMDPQTTILDAALVVRGELPFSCRGGMCATCKAKIVAGDAHMDKNYALVAEDLDAGFVLTCQARPISDAITVDFDSR